MQMTFWGGRKVLRVQYKHASEMMEVVVREGEGLPVALEFCMPLDDHFNGAGLELPPGGAEGLEPSCFYESIQTFHVLFTQCTKIGVAVFSAITRSAEASCFLSSPVLWSFGGT